MIRKKIISKMNTDVSCKLSQFVRNWFVFFGIIICLVAFSVVADEAPDTEKKEDEVVQQSEDKPAPAESTESENAADSAKKPSSDSDEESVKVTQVIKGTSDEMKWYQKTGITIFIGNAKTTTYDEQGIEIGFLNADKITVIGDPQTGKTKKIIAEDNVETRDDKIFATCEYMERDFEKKIIRLKEKVVVLQNNDRLETKDLTYNTDTGERTAVGDVKFTVNIIQTTPTSTPDETEESDPDSKETSEATSEGKDKETPSETEKGAEKKSDSDKSDAEEKTKPSETDKEEKDVESESEEDKESEPTESEETESTESEEEEDKEETPKETE